MWELTFPKKFKCFEIWGFHGGEDNDSLGFGALLKPWRWRRYVSPKRRHLPTNPHGTKTQNIDSSVKIVFFLRKTAQMFATLVVGQPDTQIQKSKVFVLLASYIGVLSACARPPLRAYVSEASFALPCKDKSIALFRAWLSYFPVSGYCGITSRQTHYFAK
jgi:hypothetical protein